MEFIKRLVEVSSPTEDVEACRNAVVEAGSILFDITGSRGCVDEVMGRPILRWGTKTPKVLLVTHLDTVWPHGSFGAMWTVDGDKMSGPGVFDMKSGFVQAAMTLKGRTEEDGVTIIGTTDEETGSNFSKDYIQSIAKHAKAALVFEASHHGALKTARKGSAAYRVVVHGRAAHAGLEPEKGINASVEIAQIIPSVLKIARYDLGTSVVPTTLVSGTTMNTVPAKAVLDVDVRALKIEELHRVDAEIRALACTTTGGATVVIEGDIERPPMEPESSEVLFRMACECAVELGMPPLTCVRVGGVSDGNYTAAVGVPTLDGLGAIGDLAHAPGEWASIRSVEERSKLACALVNKILSQNQ
jgi:glutamate carboxypeptidase